MEMDEEYSEEDSSGEGEAEMEMEGGDEELSEEDMEEAKKMMPKLNIKIIMLKDKMRGLGKFKDMLDPDEEEDDYNG